LKTTEVELEDEEDEEESDGSEERWMETSRKATCVSVTVELASEEIADKGGGSESDDAK
jgi:hypothetical protein